MKAVVTGATSFLGAALVKKLLTEGHTVYAAVRPGSKNRKALPDRAENLHILELELSRLEQISLTVHEPCDWFFHFGWDGSGSTNRKREDIQQKNAEDSMKALRGAESLGCRRFLFSGSQAEYGRGKTVMKEECPCAPVSPYGIAKADFYRRAAAYCKGRQGERRMEYIHTRIFSVYGPGDHPWSLVNTCLDTFLMNGHMELGACTQLWNFLYIDDAIDGLLALISAQKPLSEDGIYNLAGPPSATRPLREYVEEMYRLCGRGGDFAYGALPPNAEGPVDLVPDISRIRAVSGWTPRVSFEEGIRRMIEEKRKRG